MFDYKCENCGEVYHVGESHIGKRFICLKCDHINTINIGQQYKVAAEPYHENGVKIDYPQMSGSVKNVWDIFRRHKVLVVIVVLILGVLFYIGLTNKNHNDSYLANGTIITERGSSGHGELLIENGTTSDAVVKLVKGKFISKFVYIRKKSSVTIYGISTGTYTVIFATGLDWDGVKQDFKRNCSYAKFDDSLVFRETANEYTVYTITLHPVATGTAKTQNIRRDEFLGYQ